LAGGVFATPHLLFGDESVPPYPEKLREYNKKPRLGKSHRRNLPTAWNVTLPVDWVLVDLLLAQRGMNLLQLQRKMWECCP
jgi:hypothetical protein